MLIAIFTACGRHNEKSILGNKKENIRLGCSLFFVIVRINLVNFFLEYILCKWTLDNVLQDWSWKEYRQGFVCYY